MKKNKYIVENHTINSKNPFVRLSHRNRFKKSAALVSRLMNQGRLLDYGCGAGIFISHLLKTKYNNVFGYEPFLNRLCQPDLPVYDDINIIKSFAPFNIITILEVLEHLQDTEISNIINMCDELLAPNGVILISVPIEIGPVVIFKEINRFRYSKKWKYKFLEFFKTCVLGIKADRVDPHLDFMEHKGFDFRELITYIRKLGWQVQLLEYGPIPVKCWYGNSQVYLKVSRILI